MPGPVRWTDGIPTPAQRAAELTGLGGFAVWQVDTDGLTPLDHAVRPERLARRFAATRDALAKGSGLSLEQVPLRTAVSAAQIGLVSRLWSVSLGSLALHDWVPALTASRVLLADTHRNPAPMSTTDPGAGRAVHDVPSAAAALTDLVLEGAVAAVSEACRQHGRTSSTVLVSNAASSLVAAARAVGHAVPARTAQLDEVTRLLLHTPRLAAGGGYQSGAGSGTDRSHDREEFRRSGCCLYYRLPGHGLCPDCILVRQA